MAGASTTPEHCTWGRRELGGDGGLNSLGRDRDWGSIKDSQAWRKQSSRLRCYWHSAVKTGWLPTLAPQIWRGAGQELQCDTVCWWKIQKGIILLELSVSCNFLQRSTSIFLALVKFLPPLLLIMAITEHVFKLHLLSTSCIGQENICQVFFSKFSVLYRA